MNRSTKWMLAGGGLALAALLVRGGEYVALLGRDRIPYTGRTALTRLAEPLLRGGPEFDRGQVPVVRLPRYGRVVLFSDFLTPLAEVEDEDRRTCRVVRQVAIVEGKELQEQTRLQRQCHPSRCFQFAH